jgi:ribosomal protein L7/L12
MNKQEFNSLAERVLLAVVASYPEATAQFYGQQAVKITEEFSKSLSLRHAEQAKKKTSLTPDEIALIREGNVIGAVGLVKDRTNMNLKECKDLVDKAKDEIKNL